MNILPSKIDEETIGDIGKRLEEAVKSHKLWHRLLSEDSRSELSQLINQVYIHKKSSKLINYGTPLFLPIELKTPS